MKSIASAPAKIILFGEHFVVHGTKAILAAIDKRVTVTTTFTENKTIKVNSQLGILEVPISSSHEEVKSEFRPFVYLANKIINSDQNASGLEITIDSDIPIGVGLGSSSACCVAAAASISELFNELSSEEILKMSENQKYLEEIQISNDTLRDMINSLKEISLGTKITGAGDGGCIIALIKDESMDKVSALLPKDKEYFSAKIDTKGVVWSTIEE